MNKETEYTERFNKIKKKQQTVYFYCYCLIRNLRKENLELPTLKNKMLEFYAFGCQTFEHQYF